MGIELHAAPRLRPAEVTTRAGIPVTGLPWTLLGLAEADPARLARAVEQADRLRILRLADLEELCARERGRRGVARLRRALGELVVDDPGNGELERAFAEFVRIHGLPEPARNVVVHGFEADALWPAQRVIVEVDSRAYHSHAAAFERDRRRYARLATAGYQVIPA